MRRLMCQVAEDSTVMGARRRQLLRRTTTTIVACVAALGCLALMGVQPPQALAAAPAWKITVASLPTRFQPGSAPNPAAGEALVPQYSIVATNIGSGPASGSITITDDLPQGLRPVEPFFNTIDATVHHACSVSGTTVTCIGQDVEPDQFLEVTIPVEVDVLASGELENRVKVSAAAGEAVAATRTTVGEGLAPFDFLPGSAGLSVAATSPEGAPAWQAGSRPEQLTIDAGFPTVSENNALFADGHLRRLRFHLPRGMAFNPTATELCTEIELESGDCPDGSAVGTVTVRTALTSANALNTSSPIYNMVPAPGVAAELAFNALKAGIFVHVRGGVNSAGEYELSADTREILARELNPIIAVQAKLWGDPSAPSHDIERGNCVEGHGLCPVERRGIPALTMPTSCPTANLLSASAEPWETSQAVSAARALEDPRTGMAVPTVGCGGLEFKPSVSVHTSSSTTDSPSGLDFDLHQPQNEVVGGLSTANLKDAKVTLPAGLTVNPSSANGLAACSEAQIGYQPSEGRIRFTEAPQSCPDAAKLGTLEVSTPLLAHKLPGSIYLAAPHQNPFGSLLAIYLAIEDEGSGIIAKLAGRVDSDPQTGQLTATFTENPELPLEDVALHFFPGARAPLKTPATCGSFQTTSTMTPWTTPEGADAHPSDTFAISRPALGGACPGSEPALPSAPDFAAGTIEPSAATYSPFVLHLSRPDGSQQIAAIDTVLPEGLVGKLAGIPYCAEADIAAAAARTGIAEQQSPSCPPSSQVGVVNVGAGAGSEPIHVAGNVYLAGPYKGAPLSLTIITPAVAGPFDLGTVVVRAALYVDPLTAQITAKSDPIPHILEGIPLDVRSIDLSMDRPSFTLNPTSCAPMSVTGSAVSLFGADSPLANRFQVGGCKSLKFGPKLKLRLKGPVRRAGHPSLKAVVTYPKKGRYANIARAQVGLPHSEFLDQGNLNKVCKQADLRAATCPKSSIYGHAKAWTPLLEKPLEGPVYLGVGFGYKLPALVADLNGQIRILLVGRVDTTKRKGIRNTFEVVPDAPVSRFVLTLKGGKKYGLLENSENICRKAQRASALFDAQNGLRLHLRPKIANSCRQKKHPRRGNHRGDRRGKQASQDGRTRDRREG